MTHDGLWLSKYNEGTVFIDTNHGNPSKHRIEEHQFFDFSNITGIR